MVLSPKCQDLGCTRRTKPISLSNQNTVNDARDIKGNVQVLSSVI
jgi:hypothetical protein